MAHRAKRCINLQIIPSAVFAPGPGFSSEATPFSLAVESMQLDFVYIKRANMEMRIEQFRKVDVYCCTM